jgi:hypothetical protein
MSNSGQLGMIRFGLRAAGLLGANVRMQFIMWPQLGQQKAKRFCTEQHFMNAQNHYARHAQNLDTLFATSLISYLFDETAPLTTQTLPTLCSPHWKTCPRFQNFSVRKMLGSFGSGVE